jgi:hypothetical protein
VRPRTTRKHSRRSALIIGIGACVVVAGVVTAVTWPRATSTAADRITAYQAAIKDPVQHWGRIEIYGMQAAISDLRAGTGVPAEAITGEAQAWRDALVQIRGQFIAADAPSELGPASAKFQQALALYLEAADTVKQATIAAPDVRQALIDRAVAAARQGDCVYDDASVDLQNARHSADLPTTPDFPNHPCAAAGAGDGQH